MTDLDYKLACVDRLATVMKQKLREKEPRPSWREQPLPVSVYFSWIVQEMHELLDAKGEEVWREAADVANMAMIYADVKTRGDRP